MKSIPAKGNRSYTPTCTVPDTKGEVSVTVCSGTRKSYRPAPQTKMSEPQYVQSKKGTTLRRAKEFFAPVSLKIVIGTRST